MSTHQPTAEQQAVIDTYGTGSSLVVQAGAGTGKTSTLRAVANAYPRTSMQYMAFNRSIVDEAAATFPNNCTVKTVHQLAWREVIKTQGSDFGRRLRAPRMKGDHVARLLGIGPFNVTFGQQTKVLQPSYLQGLVMRAISSRFCSSADEAPHRGHFEYIDGIDLPDGAQRTYDNNDRVRDYLTPFLADAWRDLCNPVGRLRYDHAHYLKQWQLRGPRIDADSLTIDEAQDLNPVMLAICEYNAARMQLVAVGDSQQSIYGWNGAVDALDRFKVDATLYLTQSFRFGPAIADVANAILDRLDAELRLTGLDSIASDVDHLDAPACHLTRTNALAVSTLLTEQLSGRSAYLIGGGKDVLNFVRAVVELQTKGYTSHPELSCFTSWGEVQAYVSEDPSGSDLALMVGLIQDHGADKIHDALAAMPSDEHSAEVVISTAHKAKGREWSSVKLGSDFRDPKAGGELPAEEWRLLYVAATRAQHVLDPHDAAPLARLLGLDPDDDGPAALPAGGGAASHSSDPGTPGGGGAAAPTSLPAAPPAAAPGATGPRLAGQGSTGAATNAGVRPSGGGVDVAGREPAMLIGRCGKGCRFGVKLTGILVVEDHRYRGVFDTAGQPVDVPQCPGHHRRPYLRLLRVLPPDGSRCNSSCQHATKDECACACQGENHGKAHLIDVTKLADGVAS